MTPAQARARLRNYRALRSRSDAWAAGVTQLIAQLCRDRSFDALAGLPAHFDDAIVAALTRERARNEDAAFVVAAFAFGGRQASLAELLKLAHKPWWASLTRARRPAALRASLAQLIDKRPEILVGAQAAVAVTAARGAGRLSAYLPILAVDASEDSLDILLPMFDHARRQQGATLDWLRERIRPLMDDSPACRLIDDAVAARNSSSPARAFVASLGVTAPNVVRFVVSWRDPDGAVVFQVRVDSTEAAWLATRGKDGRWQPSRLDRLNLPSDAATSSLRVGSKGLDRVRLLAWAATLISARKRG